MTVFRACNHSAGGKSRSIRWTVCYDAQDRLWWRPETPTGKVRTWATYEAAATFAGSLSVQRVEYDLARQAASRIAAMDARQLHQLRTYRGMHAAYFGRDPFGLFTAALV